MISVPRLACNSTPDSGTCSVRIWSSSIRKLLVLVLVLAGTVCGPWKMAGGQTKAATTTTIAVTSNGSVVTRVKSGTVITLTASVNSGTTTLTRGQVTFCDASAKYCMDIHLLGTAQLTGKGIALLRLRPGIGSHSYKAVFLGTNSYETSSSASSSLTVRGIRPTTTTIEQSGSPGNYTLTAQVTGIINESQVPAPTGKVSFVDVTTDNTNLGSAVVGSSKRGLGFMNFSSPSMTQQANAIAAADFNLDGIQDLAVSDSNDGQILLAILLGNGDGTFRATSVSPTVGLYPDSIAVGDFNSDGIPDLAVTSVDQNIVTILLGNGDGTFSSNVPNLNTGSTPQSAAVGDFNGDGIPDLAVVNSNSVLIFLGKGDGTFSPTAVSPSTGIGPINVAVGDFNSDGKFDLAVTNGVSGTVTILLGNGDGTFQEVPLSPTTGGSPDGLAIADFNGDGIADIAVSNYSGELNGNAVVVLLGLGDGTFLPATPYAAPGLNFHSIAVGDLNGDGVADVAVGEFWHGLLAVLLGRGDGTFATAMAVDAQSQLGSGYIAVADFNGDGIPDLAVPNQGGTVPILLTQPTLSVTATISGISPTGPSPQEVYARYPGDRNFGSSISGTTTLIIQTATKTALTSSLNPSKFGQALTFTATVTAQQGSYTPSGTVSFFSGTTNLGSSPLNGSGIAAFTISTLAVGTHHMTAAYSGDANFFSSTSPVLNQVVEGAVAQFTPKSLGFGNQTVGLMSPPQTAALKNTGNVTLTISSISITGADRGDFAQNNNCPASVAPNGSCSINVTFKPTTAGTRIAAVVIVDNAPGSPQKVTVKGTGTYIQLRPISEEFGTQPVGTTSKAKTITLSNKGNAAVSIVNISITGSNASDFSQTNTCGKSVASGASCFIKVTFKPTAAGTRSAAVSVTDNGGGSPQKVSLAGTGT
jgi:hypothetical protein